MWLKEVISVRRCLVLCLVAQSCPTLCDPKDSSRPAHPSRLLCAWTFSRQEYWSGLPCPPPRDLPNAGMEPTSPALQVILRWCLKRGKFEWDFDADERKWKSKVYKMIHGWVRVIPVRKTGVWLRKYSGWKFTSSSGLKHSFNLI